SRRSRLVLPRLPDVAPPGMVPPLKLTGDEAVFASQKGPHPLEVALVTLGLGDDVLQALRYELSSSFDAEKWATDSEDVKSEREALAERWVRRLARNRVEAWLSTHPLVVEPELEPHMPDDLELTSLDDLCLVYASGLGTDLDNEQNELVREARRALKLSFRGAKSPFVLELIAERVKVPALLGSQQGRLLASRYPLAVLLYGEQAHGQAVSLGVVPSMGDELNAQFAAAREQRETKNIVMLPAEGPVFYLLSQLGTVSSPSARQQTVSSTSGRGASSARQQTVPPAGGFLLTALMGGRIGIKEVTLQLSRRLKNLPSDLRQALGQIGFGAATALAKTESPARTRLLKNLAALLGDRLLTQEMERVSEREKVLERNLSHDAVWPQIKPAQSPEMVLIRLYQRRLARQREELGVAIVRALRIFRELAYAGETRRDQELAATRFGYALSCFGPNLFSGLKELSAQVEETRPKLF
ncbi:MAG: hypothetical protein JRH20_27905, partial [Deltaproteobacteria bacterium]|nr:hypothetical protein [Deltaproteobacteria bacterium]